MAIYAYAETPANPGWRLPAVRWDGTQVVADIGCGNGFDLRQLVPARCRRAIGVDLSAGMLRTLEDVRLPGRLSLVQADAQHLPLRDESVDVALAMHMLYHVPHVEAAVRELHRIVRAGGTVLVSTNSASSLSEIHGLFDAVVSDLLGRPVVALPGLGFTTETGGAVLEGGFSEVTLRRHDVALSIPTAEPVVAYLASVRDPIVSNVGYPFDFDAALDGLAARVEQVIRVQGCFRAVSRSGVFVCR